MLRLTYPANLQTGSARAAAMPIPWASVADARCSIAAVAALASPKRTLTVPVGQCASAPIAVSVAAVPADLRAWPARFSPVRHPRSFGVSLRPGSINLNDKAGESSSFHELGQTEHGRAKSNRRDLLTRTENGSVSSPQPRLPHGDFFRTDGRPGLKAPLPIRRSTSPIGAASAWPATSTGSTAAHPKATPTSSGVALPYHLAAKP